MRSLWPLALCLCSTPVSAADLVFVAPTNHTEPIARFERDELRGGVLKDLGDALAQRLNLRPRYLGLPGKRVSDALQNGQADLICYVLPGWLDGDYLWSQPVLPNAEVVAARPGAPEIQRLEDLRGRRVGTINGYRYSHMFSGGELPFERFDAPDTRANLAKLDAGRMQYAIVEELSVRDYLRRHPQSGLRIVLVVARYTARCAQSRSSRLDFEAVDAALADMVREGEIKRILARYGG